MKQIAKEHPLEYNLAYQINAQIADGWRVVCMYPVKYGRHDSMLVVYERPKIDDTSNDQED